LHEERSLKQAVQRIGERVRAPESLRAKIISDTRIFPERSRPVRPWRDFIWPTPLGYRPALGGAFVIAVVLSAFYFFSHKKEPIAIAALDSYGLVLKRKLPVPRTANPDEIAERLTRAVATPASLPFSSIGCGSITNPQWWNKGVSPGPAPKSIRCQAFCLFNLYRIEKFPESGGGIPKSRVFPSRQRAQGSREGFLRSSFSGSCGKIRQNGSASVSASAQGAT
jgi:hypothetical protein